MAVKKIFYRPIGIIHSPFKSPKGTPIQPGGAGRIRGTVNIEKKYTEALADLKGFSHIILIYHFHLSRGYSPKVKPYMDNNPHGVFATRAPRRPNSIGLSVVRLTGVSGNILKVEGLDIIDGTPLLDIKPYVPDFDIRDVKRIGWLRERVHRLSSTKDDGRFVN